MTATTTDQTICVSGWTEMVRPPESVTAREKLASMAAYGDNGSAHDYEYDHFVPLELGGAVNDPRNLWPEPGGAPNPKDAVENELRRMVCSGEMSLRRAQHIIATDWIGWAKGAEPNPARLSPAAPSSTPSERAPSSQQQSGGPNKPVADVNCSDFTTHAAAQRWFQQHGGSPSNDVAGLDGDHDGLACESLP